MTRVLPAALALAIAWAGPRPAAVRAGGVIAGVVTTREPPPSAIRVSTDAGICGETVADESIVANAAGQVAGAVLSIDGVRVAAPADVLVANQRCAFVPHVAIVRPGGAVKLVSRDPLLHTTHAADASGKAFFNMSLPIPDLVVTRPLGKAGVVTLTCGTHTWMRGYVVQTDDAAVVSRQDGAFRLDGIPAGPHVLRVWHETLHAAPVAVTIRDGETTTVSVTLTK